MKLQDNVKILMCLNNEEMDKAYEFLTPILNNPQYINTTIDQLDQNIKDGNNQSIIEMEQRQKERENKIIDLRNEHKSSLLIISRVIAPWNENVDLLKAIDILENNSFWKIKEAFEWGYIQVKRAERARRKKATQ